MTQSLKTSRPKRKEKLSDKEQSERFIQAARLAERVAASDFENAFDKIVISTRSKKIDVS